MGFFGSKSSMNTIASAVLFSGILASAGIASAQEHTFKWSHSSPVDSIADKTTKAIVAEIEEKSDGRITFQLFPAGQLGDWIEVNEQVLRGVVDFATQPVSPSYDPRLQIRVLPYAVMNFTEVENAYFGDDPYLFTMMRDMMAENEMTALAVVAEGFGGGGFRKCPEDVFDTASHSGVKMRFPPGNQAWEKMVGALGYEPTPVPWGELYLALQTGLVDAQVGGQPFNTWTTHRDVTDCWVQFNTHFQNAFVFANSQVFDGLSEEDQMMIRDAVESHASASLDMARGEDKKYMDLMSEAGITVIVPTDEQLETIATLARQQVWPVMDDVIGKDIMDVMRQKAGLM
ncbi:MAG: TRAP transporter substrate-binding protein DctP [Pseudomonadota bacterium]